MLGQWYDWVQTPAQSSVYSRYVIGIIPGLTQRVRQCPPWTIGNNSKSLAALYKLLLAPMQEGRCAGWVLPWNLVTWTFHNHLFINGSTFHRSIGAVHWARKTWLGFSSGVPACKKATIPYNGTEWNLACCICHKQPMWYHPGLEMFWGWDGNVQIVGLVSSTACFTALLAQDLWKDEEIHPFIDIVHCTAVWKEL